MHFGTNEQRRLVQRAFKLQCRQHLKEPVLEFTGYINYHINYHCWFTEFEWKIRLRRILRLYEQNNFRLRKGSHHRPQRTLLVEQTYELACRSKGYGKCATLAADDEKRHIYLSQWLWTPLGHKCTRGLSNQESSHIYTNRGLTSVRRHLPVDIDPMA